PPTKPPKLSASQPPPLSSPLIHQGHHCHRPPSSRFQQCSSFVTQHRSPFATQQRSSAAATTTALSPPPRRRTSTSSPSPHRIRR
ncbi:hypothetical protein HN873_036592, partial [Arachis hypogaea]